MLDSQLAMLYGQRTAVLAQSAGTRLDDMVVLNVRVCSADPMQPPRNVALGYVDARGTDPWGGPLGDLRGDNRLAIPPETAGKAFFTYRDAARILDRGVLACTVIENRRDYRDAPIDLDLCVDSESHCTVLLETSQGDRHRISLPKRGDLTDVVSRQNDTLKDDATLATERDGTMPPRSECQVTGAEVHHGMVVIHLREELDVQVSVALWLPTPHDPGVPSIMDDILPSSDYCARTVLSFRGTATLADLRRRVESHWVLAEGSFLLYRSLETSTIFQPEPPALLDARRDREAIASLHLRLVVVVVTFSVECLIRQDTASPRRSVVLVQQYATMKEFVARIEKETGIARNVLSLTQCNDGETATSCYLFRGCLAPELDADDRLQVPAISAIREPRIIEVAAEYRFTVRRFVRHRRAPATPAATATVFVPADESIASLSERLQALWLAVADDHDDASSSRHDHVTALQFHVGPCHHPKAPTVTVVVPSIDLRCVGAIHAQLKNGDEIECVLRPFTVYHPPTVESLDGDEGGDDAPCTTTTDVPADPETLNTTSLSKMQHCRCISSWLPWLLIPFVVAAAFAIVGSDVHSHRALSSLHQRFSSSIAPLFR